MLPGYSDFSRVIFSSDPILSWPVYGQEWFRSYQNFSLPAPTPTIIHHATTCSMVVGTIAVRHVVPQNKP